MKAAGFFLCLWMLFCIPASLQAQIPEQPSDYVTDLTATLSDEEFRILCDTLGAFEQRTQHQVFILMINDADGDYRDIDDLGPEIANQWGVGQAGADNGVLITVIKDKRMLRIDVGYGLEPDLTDIETMYIRENYMNPRFKGGDFFKGLMDGSREVIRHIEDVQYEYVQEDPYAYDPGFSYLDPYTDADGFTHDSYYNYTFYEELEKEYSHEKVVSLKWMLVRILPVMNYIFYGLLGGVWVFSWFLPTKSSKKTYPRKSWKGRMLKKRWGDLILLFPILTGFFFWLISVVFYYLMGIPEFIGWWQSVGFIPAGVGGFLVYGFAWMMKLPGGGGGGGSSYRSSSYSSGSSYSSYSGGGGSSYSGGGSSFGGGGGGSFGGGGSSGGW